MTTSITTDAIICICGESIDQHTSVGGCLLCPDGIHEFDGDDSPAGDAAVDVEESDVEELDDFDSDDLEDVAPSDHGYLRGMWGSYSFRAAVGDKEADSSSIAKDTVTAHGMVQSFVNAFARDGHYAVTFDRDCSTAGTDMTDRNVVITPAPVADRSLTAEEAGLILTGLAVHEISHPRYGKNTAMAVQKVFPRNRVADRLSNLLDDVRIERRFVADYPGYSGVFEPTLNYVGSSQVKKNRNVKPTMVLSQPVNLAIAAIRYPDFATWTEETDVERVWWSSWADRSAKEDSPKRHVAAIREALQHIVDTKPAAQPKSKTENTDESGPMSTSTGQANDTEEIDADGSTDDPSDSDAPRDPDASTEDADAALNEETKDADAKESVHTPSCSGSETVDQAVLDNEVTARDIRDLKHDAEEIVRNARNQEDGVDVARSLKGITHGGTRLGGSSLAQRYVRNAILRSRTGHTEVNSFQRHGRLDQKGLSRIAEGDVRVFERRTAPSPGHYDVWVMIDASGSMDDNLPYAAQVAHAIASATQGTQSVRLTVWAWSSPFRPSSAYAGVAKVWETGQPTDQIFRMAGLRTGGTPDGKVLSWATKALKRDVRGDETPVILFISDGSGDSDMNRRVTEARDKGIIVKSISFGGYLSPQSQEERFGRGNFVPWMGSIIKTAKPLADLFAKITSGR